MNVGRGCIIQPPTIYTTAVLLLSFCNASTAGAWGKRPPRAGLPTSLRQGNKPAWGADREGAPS